MYFVYVCICVYTCVYVCLCVFMCVYVYIYIYLWIYIGGLVGILPACSDSYVDFLNEPHKFLKRPCWCMQIMETSANVTRWDITNVLQY